jgi:hypothetical protein
MPEPKIISFIKVCKGLSIDSYDWLTPRLYLQQYMRKLCMYLVLLNLLKARLSSLCLKQPYSGYI